MRALIAFVLVVGSWGWSPTFLHAGTEPESPNSESTRSESAPAESPRAVSSTPEGTEPRGIVVREAWVRLPPPQVPAAGYMVISNESSHVRKLVAVRSARAVRVELHRSWVEGGVARMEPLAEVEIPAQGSVRFEPGGIHLMLIAPDVLADGERVPLELQLDAGQVIRAEAAVRP